MVYYSPADHSELKRTLYTANFVFLFKTNVPNELIPINPLGLAITYFREDEASIESFSFVVRQFPVSSSDKALASTRLSPIRQPMCPRNRQRVEPIFYSSARASIGEIRAAR
jgi:hypothetical protein